MTVIEGTVEHGVQQAREWAAVQHPTLVSRMSYA